MTILHDKRGFTLIEMMMSLVILAMLMTAVGAAIDGSLNSCSENNNIASATQLGRMILGRMLREVRTCVDLDSTSQMLDITPPDPVAETDPTRIVYEVVDGVLVRRTTVQGDESSQELLGGQDGTSVEAFVVLREDDFEGNPISVTVRLVLGVDDRIFAMTTSATIRNSQFE